MGLLQIAGLQKFLAFSLNHAYRFTGASRDEPLI